MAAQNKLCQVGYNGMDYNGTFELLQPFSVLIVELVLLLKVFVHFRMIVTKHFSNHAGKTNQHLIFYQNLIR